MNIRTHNIFVNLAEALKEKAFYACMLFYNVYMMVFSVCLIFYGIDQLRATQLDMTNILYSSILIVPSMYFAQHLARKVNNPRPPRIGVDEIKITISIMALSFMIWTLRPGSIFLLPVTLSGSLIQRLIGFKYLQLFGTSFGYMFLPIPWITQAVLARHASKLLRTPLQASKSFIKRM